jgi:hypothetical protein
MITTSTTITQHLQNNELFLTVAANRVSISLQDGEAISSALSSGVKFNATFIQYPIVPAEKQALM